MERDFQSLNKGVFFVRHQPVQASSNSAASPSHQNFRLKRPLKRYYDEAFERYKAAHEEFESSRVGEQVSEVSRWLEECDQPRWPKVGGGTYRVPLGVLQKSAPTLDARLRDGGVGRHVHVVSLDGKDIGDVGAGAKGIAVGLMGDQVGAKRSGRSGLDEAESWYTSLAPSLRSPVIVHITSAQTVPFTTMSELIYVLALHPALPIRLVLSVPSTATFLESLHLVEQASVDLWVFESGKRKRGGAVGAILRADSGLESGLRLGRDLREKLKEDDEGYGIGAVAALKVIKLALLHHSVNSPLATLAQTDMARAEQLLREPVDGQMDELLDIALTDGVIASLEPAPRVSVIHALSNTADFTKHASARLAAAPHAHEPMVVMPTTSSRKRAKTNADDRGGAIGGETSSPKKRRKSRQIRTPSPPPISFESAAHAMAMPTGDPMGDRGDLQELEILFNLFRAAGRNVNLWDWLEGFRSEVKQRGQKGFGAATAGAAGGTGDEGGIGDGETSARLHATFVRFCEEARMMGLMRARGNARRRGVDEVVKSVALM